MIARLAATRGSEIRRNPPQCCAISTMDRGRAGYRAGARDVASSYGR